MTAPDLSKLPEPLRLLLQSAISERANTAPPANGLRASERWFLLVAAVTHDLDPELLPYANIHKQPEGWTGEEPRRAVTISLPDLAPIVVWYEAAVNPPGWVCSISDGWQVEAGRVLGSLKEALLAAFDAATSEVTEP